MQGEIKKMIKGGGGEIKYKIFLSFFFFFGLFTSVLM